MSCERCADPTTYADLELLATDPERHSVLLRCPGCGSLHEAFPEEKGPAHPLTPLEARRRYPDVHDLLPARATDYGGPRLRVRRLPDAGREPRYEVERTEPGAVGPSWTRDVDALVRRLERAGFTVAHERGSGTVDRVVELHSPGLDVRLVGDRGQWSVDLGDAACDEWRPLDRRPERPVEDQVAYVAEHRAELAHRAGDPRPWPRPVRYTLLALLVAVVGIGVVTVLYDRGFLPIAGPFVLLFLLPLLAPLQRRGQQRRRERR